MNKKSFLLCFCLIVYQNIFTNENKEIYNEYLYAFIEANRQEFIGNIIESAKLYMHCLEYNPNDATVLYKLSKIYYSVNQLDKAIEFARKAYENKPENDWYMYNIVHMYIEYNLINSAIKILKKKDNKSINNELLQRSYLEIYFKKEKYKKAKNQLKKIEKKSRIMIIMEVHCNNMLGKYKESIEILNNIIEYEKQDCQLLAILAETYSKSGDYVKAKNTYKKIFNIEPGNSLYWLSYFDYSIVSNENKVSEELSKKIIQKGNIKINDKIYVLDHVNKVFNDTSLIYREIKKIIFKQYNDWNKDSYKLKEYWINNKQREIAINYMKSLLNKNENNPGFWQNFLFTLNFSNNDTIIKYSEIAYKKFRNDPLYIWFYAVALKNGKEYYKAENILRNIKINSIENEKLKAEIYILKGEINETLENYDDADKNFEMAIIIDPKNLIIKNNYAYYLSLRSEKLNYALKLINECIIDEPKNFIFLDTYGWILFKLKKIRKAKKVIKKAIIVGGDKHAEILEHYGDILYEEKKEQKAIEYWEKALRKEMEKNKRDKLEEKMKKIR